MKFAATFLTDPPAKELVSRAQAVEDAGFDYVFLNEAQTLFMDPWPIFAAIACATEQIAIGPCVTNPTLRDPVVTAALLATLNEMSGGRMVCGIGRGDAAPRTLGRPPATVSELAAAITTIRELVTAGAKTRRSSETSLRWNPGWELEIWGAGYGPKTLRAIGALCDGYIVQGAHFELVDLAAEFVAAGLADRALRSAPRPMVAAPAYVGSVATGHEQLRWFVPSVANHMAVLAKRHAAPLPTSLTAILENRSEYDYQAKGRSDNRGADYVTREMTQAFTLVGTSADHIAKIEALAARNVAVVNLYLHHDQVPATIAAYGREIIPRFQ